LAIISPARGTSMTNIAIIKSRISVSSYGLMINALLPAPKFLGGYYGELGIEIKTIVDTDNESIS
jgi:hypothetical protein